MRCPDKPWPHICRCGQSLTIATCDARIRLDSIFADVAKIEKDMMKPYYQNAIDYTLKGRRRINVAKYFRFNNSNDTVYIMDMYYGKGDCPDIYVEFTTQNKLWQL